MTERKRGRPAFKPTQLHRRKVEQYTACGMSHDGIAKALGISDETLRKHFAEELSSGKAKRRAEVVDILFAAARKGNVAAAKTLEQMTGKSLALAEFMGHDKPASRPVEKSRRLGKKEQAAQDALEAGVGTEWGTDLLPRGQKH
jgi:hypothetical protein